MKAIRVFLLILIIIGLCLLVTQRFWVPRLVVIIMNYTDEINPSKTVIFEKRASWGPCPSEKGCFEVLYLYESGKLVVENEKGHHENQAPKNFVERFEQAVEQTGIMQKKCAVAYPVMDYSLSYTITHKGREKKIEYPGCEEEMKKIDALFQANEF